MPTYNFKSNGEIEIDGVVKQVIEGPAVLSPRALADNFTLKYLDGSDLYYYSTNTFEIDGVEFEGTLTEFTEAANELYVSAGGGTGEAYPDIDADTAIQVDNACELLVESASRPLLEIRVANDAHRVLLGDTDTTDAPTCNVMSYQNETSSLAKLTATLDGETSASSVQAYSNTPNITGALMDFFNADDYFSVGVDPLGINLTGIVEYADNAAALTAGLTAGYLYRTGEILKVVY